MTSLADAKPDLESAFAERAWARAYLYACGELSLQDAVDALQRAAEAYGLVRRLGQDEVQQLMAEAFVAVRDLRGAPTELVTNALPDDAIEPKAGAADSTCDAVLCALRRDGAAALGRQVDRLSQLSTRQLERLIASLSRLGADEQLLLILAEMLP
jgi:hypothetical protein